MKDESPENLEPVKAQEIDDDLNCPLCGGKTVNQWSRICVKILYTFLISLLLSFIFVVFAESGLKILFLLVAGITIISLFTLPITGAFAIVSRSRCQTCGHRFWPASIAPHLPADAQFPVKYAIIGTAVLFLAFCIELVLIINSPGREVFSVILLIAGLILLAGLVPGVSILIQSILWRNLCGRTDNEYKPGTVLLHFIVVIILGSIVLTIFFRSSLVTKYNPLTRAPHTLAWAELANLPESARDVRVYSSCVLFVRTDYLRFEADPEDIERFIADSPGLKGITCRTYSKKRMRLATSNYGIALVQEEMRNDPNFVDMLNINGSSTKSFYIGIGVPESIFTDTNEYFYSIHDTPSWYKEEIRGAGRYYDLNENDRGCLSELIVDDEKHIVYVFKGS